MSDLDKSKEELVAELATLRQEVAELKIERTVFDVQSELLTTLETTARTGSRSLVLKALLQDAIKISNRIAEPQESSLFLLDSEGRVVESILARGATIRQQKETLIGRVFKKGLAGWIVQNRQMGLIEDTKEDDRWLTLPNQPYTVRSALGVPILRNRNLLGIITLTHSTPYYFTPECAQIMKKAAAAMAPIVELARLFGELSPQSVPPRMPATPPARLLSRPPIPKPKTPLPKPQTPPPEPPRIQHEVKDLSSIGLYIIVWDGKFLYANRRLAKMFGYPFKELLGLSSIFELVSLESYDDFAERVYRCIRGQTRTIHCQFSGQRKDRHFVDVELYGSGTTFYGKAVIVGAMRSLPSKPI